jgi:hypothetical protein
MADFPTGMGSSHYHLPIEPKVKLSSDLIEPNAVKNAFLTALNGSLVEKKAFLQIATEIWVNHMLQKSPPSPDIGGVLNAIIEILPHVDPEDVTEAFRKMAEATGQLKFERDYDYGHESPELTAEVAKLGKKIVTMEKMLNHLKADLNLKEIIGEVIKALTPEQVYEMTSQIIQDIQKQIQDLARKIGS